MFQPPRQAAGRMKAMMQKMDASCKKCKANRHFWRGGVHFRADKHCGLDRVGPEGFFAPFGRHMEKIGGLWAAVYVM